MKSESVFLGEPNVITLRIQPDDARCPSRRGFLPAWKTAQSSERSYFSPLRSFDGPTPGLSASRKLGTPNENAARRSLTGDSAASPIRSSSSDYKSLLSSWRCRFECYHDLPECVEIVHLVKRTQSQRSKNCRESCQTSLPSRSLGSA